MTIDEIITIVTAFKDGKRIEKKLKGDSVWVERISSEPTFNFQSYDYRVDSKIVE